MRSTKLEGFDFFKKQPPSKRSPDKPASQAPFFQGRVIYPDQDQTPPPYAQAYERVERDGYEGTSENIEEVSVHSPTQGSQWREDVAMFEDSRGYYITPPNLLVWDGDRGNHEWASPFDEFAQMYPEEAEEIGRRYARSRPEYFNVRQIVRKYGPQADPYRGYERW